MSSIKKFKVLGLIFLFALVYKAEAQRVDISLDYGYQMGTKLNYGSSNYVKATDGGFFRGIVGFELASETMLELTYMKMNSDLLVRDFFISPSEERLADLSMDWIHLGSNRYFDTGGDITPFLGLSAGVTIFTPKNENFDIVDRSLNSSTEFSFLIKGGAIFNVSDVVGIKFQADLMFPVSWGGYYYGYGGAFYSGGTTVMGAISGGLVFTLGG